MYGHPHARSFYPLIQLAERRRRAHRRAVVALAGIAVASALIFSFDATRAFLAGFLG